MDLQDEERYASAALFTLALHLSQVDHNPMHNNDQAAWGQTQDGTYDDRADCHSSNQGTAAAAAEWSAFWGWDCCGPNGILDQMYLALKVPEKSWPGLKRLPDIGGLSGSQRRQYLKLVSSYIKVLDNTLSALHSTECEPASVQSNDAGLGFAPDFAGELEERLSGGSPPAELRAAPKFLDDLMTDSDSDLEEDLASARLQLHISKQHSIGLGTEPLAGVSLPNTFYEEGLAALPKTDAAASHSEQATKQAAVPEHASGPKYDDEAADLAYQEVANREQVLAEPSNSLSHLPSDSQQSTSSKQETQGTEDSPESCSRAAAIRPSKSYSLAETLANALKSWDPAGSAEISKANHVLGQGIAEGASPPAKSNIGEQKVSAKALAVMWELLEACVHNPAMTGSADGFLTESLLVGGLPPVVRWYDARQRCSLRLIGVWLRVPWKMMANFECLLVYRLMLPPEESGKASLSSWDHSLRAAKIGAATLGIGAIFAVTGGLAAPAIAAGIGAAIGLAGGSAAVATGVTGFLATSAGGAVVASAVGAAGSGLAVGHLAHRIGVVKEFGFWALDKESTGRAHGMFTSALAGETATADTGPPAAAEQHANASPDSRIPSSATGSCQDLSQSADPEAQPQPLSQENHVMLTPSQPPDTQSKTMGLCPHQRLQMSKDATPDQEPGQTDKRRAGFAWSFPWPGKTLKPQGGNSRTMEISHALPGLDIQAKGKELPSHSSQEYAPADHGHIFLHPGATSDCPSEATEKPLPGAASSEPAEPKKIQAGSQGWGWTKSGPSSPPLLPGPVSANRKVEDMRMSLTIGICGWIKDRSDFLDQWQDLTACQQSSEAFTLVWESKELIELNSAIVAFAASQAGQEAAKWVLQHFFFTGLVAALAWPAAIYSAVQLIDTAWSVTLQRAQKAGQLLAHVLAAGAHGNRPVILVGNSMGARLIFHCLLELARLKAKGIVEHACLLGTPVAVRPERWAMARSVVAGRLINGYSRKDWLLAIVYRGSNGFIKDAAGLGPIAMSGIENVNLTGLIQGHFEYIDKVAEILDLIGLYS